ncbi:MAG: protein-L-isoaspartate(D-aspartate) O-methyltransferase [Candidatus Zixiibacteriota bacterium]
MIFGRDRNGQDEVDFISQRLRMVDQQLISRGIRDAAVLNAMRAVPRHKFVPEPYLPEAYADGPLPIGQGQTISQPFVVASMTEELELDRKSRVLEVGTGSGYQSAVLAEIAKDVYSMEVIPELIDGARQTLSELGYTNVHMRVGDGSVGWPEEAPFDGIIITAAAPRIPEKLVEQLVDGGRMILPLSVGSFGRQDLVKIRKKKEGLEQQVLYEVRFVPMVGQIEKNEHS